MAKIHKVEPIKNLSGTVVIGDTGKPLFISHVVINAILATLPNEDIDGVEKLKRFEFARSLYDCKEPVFELDACWTETVLCRIEKIYGTLVYARAHEILTRD